MQDFVHQQYNPLALRSGVHAGLRVAAAAKKEPSLVFDS